MLSTIQNSHKYKARITNLSQGLEITEHIDALNISMPRAREISSMVATFKLENKLIESGNEIKIEVLDEVGNTIYSLTGEAILQNQTYNYTNLKQYSYEIKDSYSKLFEKVIAKTEVFYDLYLCNSGDTNNSLMHKVAEKLGITRLEFVNATFETGEFIRVPFVIFRENERWLDELQTLISATNSILYIKGGKLFFKVCNFSLNKSLKFDRTNIIKKLSKTAKHSENNGVKILFDRYKKLENQVVFNLQSKITVERNTGKDTEVKAMRISYITSSVASPTITKASAYYFTTTNTSSKVDVELVRNVHYVLEEFTETGATVKFYNPFNYDLIIDNFEIKGLPLVLYKDNSVVVKNSNVRNKGQENFIVVPKNKYVQSSKLAENIAKQVYRANISSAFNYEFDTIFLSNLELGEIYNINIENIDVKARLLAYSIQLKTSDFRISAKLEEVGEHENISVSHMDSLNSDTQYVDLSNVEKSIKENEKHFKELEADVRSRFFRMTTEPLENVKENDIWLNPDTNVWKKFYNGVWNSISEVEILPSMKMYNSIENNIIKLQKTDDRVGAYLLNDGEKFGSLNGELAHIHFDKLGQFEAVNPNNKIALNIKDPTNPERVNSSVILGVTNVKDNKWNDVIFAVGDEASDNSIIFRNGSLKQKVNGQDLGEKISEIDRNIQEVNAYTDAKFRNADGKLTQLTENYTETVRDLTNFKTSTSHNIDTVKGALENGNFVINSNTTFSEGVRFVSRGTNETITIANGSIDFHRDGQKLTRIKNIRYGTIFTDSAGRGIVNFTGFKQPMIVLTSIKAANFGKNMASVFCYPEHIRDTQYRFYVGGTNEDYREARAVKVVGKVWEARDVMSVNLSQLTFNFPVHFNEFSNDRNLDVRKYVFIGKHRYRRPSDLNWSTAKTQFGLTQDDISKIIANKTGNFVGGNFNEYGENYENSHYNRSGGVDGFPRRKSGAEIEAKKILMQPLILDFKLLLNNEVIWRKSYTIDLMNSDSYGDYFYKVRGENIISINGSRSNLINETINLNIKKRFKNRTNVNIRFEATANMQNIEAYQFSLVDVEKQWENYEYYLAKKTIYTFSESRINTTITASAETSTISDATGEGEVQYIAMEVD